MNDNNKTSFNMRFAEININKYSQFDLKLEFDKTRIPLVEFHSNFAFQVFKDKEQIGCLTTIKLTIIETKELYAELKVENIFEIKPFEKIVKSNENNQFDIPNDLLRNLVSISISTVRGILSEKLKGTIAQSQIYPLVNPSDLFKKNT